MTSAGVGAVPPHQRHMVAVLRCCPDALLTGAAVLGLLGIEGFDAVRRAVLTTPQRLLDRALAALFFAYRPTLAFNVWLLPGIRADAVWEDARLVLEYDGRAYHSLPTDRERDQARDERLKKAGYEVMRIRWEDLRDPEALRRCILARRQARLATLNRASVCHREQE